MDIGDIAHRFGKPLENRGLRRHGGEWTAGYAVLQHEDEFLDLSNPQIIHRSWRNS
jgi:hypothetical protein